MVLPAEIIVAAVACIVASEAALLPIFLARGASQAGVAQAALLGSLIHLMGIVVPAAVMYLRFHPHFSFTLWLFAFYATTLAFLVATFVRAVRSAPITTRF
jgi:hypothetical protein